MVNNTKKRIDELFEKIVSIKHDIDSRERPAAIEIDLMKEYLRNLYAEYVALHEVIHESKLHKREEFLINQTKKESEQPLFEFEKEDIKNEAVKSNEDSEKEEIATEDPMQTSLPADEEKKKEPIIEEETKKNVSVADTEPNETHEPQINIVGETNHEEESASTLAEKIKSEQASLYEKYNNKSEDKSISAQIQKKPITDLKEAIGINERFLLTNELFDGSMPEYNNSIKKLNSFNAESEAIGFLGSLKETYGWPDDSNAFILLFELVKRRYM